MANSKTQLDLSDILDLEMPEKQSSLFRTQKHEIYSHSVFLDEDIGPPTKYRDLIYALYSAGQNDQFNIMINSPGGYLSSALGIIEAIKNSDAIVRAVINGECHSAASMIALNCDEIIITDAAHVMVHTASYGAGGSTGNVKSHTDFYTGMINEILDTTYSGFLTDDEMKDMKKGVEFWFDAGQIRKRINARSKFLEEKHAAKAKVKKTKSKSETVLE